MRTKTKTVYYCDYCSKHTLTINSMFQHEKHCTGNLDRKCGLCDNLIAYRVVIAKFLTDIKQPKVEDLMDAVKGCPICCLTVIKALKRENEFVWIDDFDYEEELKKWWEEKNSEQAFCEQQDLIQS